MKPYFEKDGITIYHADCRDVLRSLPAGLQMVLITDPPYGVDLGNGKDMRRDGHGLGKRAYLSFDDSYESFVSEIVPRLNEALDRCCRAAVFTGPHIHEQRKPDTIGGIHCPAAQGRHQWGFKTLLPVLLYGKAPRLNEGGRPTSIVSSELPEPASKFHPCPKPLGWMRWLVKLTSTTDEIILDPFAGSGTTLIAARDCGCRAIGIEISEAYCAIAARRLAQGVLKWES